MNSLADSPAEPELNRLLAELCGGELVAADQQGLIVLLEQSAAARETYVRYMSVHAELMWRFVGKHATTPQNGTAPQTETARDVAAPSRGEPLVGPRAAAEPPASKPAQSAWLGFLADAVRVVPGGDAVVGGLVILAVVGALCGVAFYIHSSRLVEVAQQSPTNSSAAATKAVAATNSAAAMAPAAAPGARVGSLQADLLATWSPQAATPAGGVARVGRRYDLASGRVEIALTTGARLVIGGPAVWQFDTEQRLSLHRGEALVYVPAAAKGFTVTTPTAEIVDLGTEFIVAVGETAETRVAVVRGSVQLATIGPAADAQSLAPSRTAVLVSAGHAVKVSGKDARRAVTATTNFDADWVQRIARLGQSSVANEVIAFQALPTGMGGNQPGSTTVGNDFEVREPIRVTGLGVFDSLGDGIDPGSTLTVKLWAIDDHGAHDSPRGFTGKQVLAERTFAADSPGMLRGCYRFKPLLEPIDLPPGTYSVAVDGFTLQNPFFNSNYPFHPPLQKDPRAESEVSTSRYAIMPRGPRYANQATPGVFPDEAESSGSYFAGSFTYAPLEASK